MTGQLRSEIRPFATTDRETVWTLWADAFPNEPAYNQSQRMIARKLRVQPELFLVAVEDGVVAGTVMAGYDGVRGWIHRLAVARTARRRGIGTALLREAEMRLLALGCPKVNLQVRASNAGVVAFYEAAGYKVEANISMARTL
jgi:ribosomal protein S18 acetylase RimI-like enzyme